MNWISVKDRLPDYDIEVIVPFDGYIVTAWRVEGYEDWAENHPGCGCCGERFIDPQYWAPMPELPKEESE